MISLEPNKTPDRLDRTARAAELLRELGVDFNPEDEPINPSWLEIKSWGAEGVEAILGAAWAEPELTIAAVNIIGKRKDKNAVLPLSDMLETIAKQSPEDYDDELEWGFEAAAIIDALGDIGDPRAIASLNKFLARMLGIKTEELERAKPSDVLLNVFDATPEADEMLICSLVDAYEALGVESTLPLASMLAFDDEINRDSILGVLDHWDARKMLPIIEIIAKRGTKEAQNLLEKWNKAKGKA